MMTKIMIMYGNYDNDHYDDGDNDYDEDDDDEDDKNLLPITNKCQFLIAAASWIVH